jgi:hypothetical protein
MVVEAAAKDEQRQRDLSPDALDCARTRRERGSRGRYAIRGTCRGRSPQ